MPRPSCATASLMLALAACSGGRDPILDRADEMNADGGVSSDPAGAPPAGRPEPQPVAGAAPASAPAPAPAPAVEPQPGQPADPPPGVPDGPPPAPSGDGQGGDPGSTPPSGPQVVLSGTVSVVDWTGGPIRIDVFDGDQQAAAGSEGPRPSIVAVARLERPGAFTLTVPASGPVWVGGFVDADQDGKPSHTDPSGWFGGNPVDASADAAGIQLTLAPPGPPPAE